MSEPAINQDEQLIEAMQAFVYDPLGFVYFAYPWNKPGVLVNETGPDEWQKKELVRIGKLTKDQADGKHKGPIQIAIKAGRDPGKTALLAWIIHWFVSTRPNPTGVVTANTATQLSTKTWRELAKWHNISIHYDWFDWTAEKFALKGQKSTWFMAAIPWSKERAQSMAGTHEDYVLIVFDEGSQIEDIIWETIEAGLTDPFCLWVVGGNPTKNTGRFKECWGKFRHRWITSTIDSRDAKRPDKAKIEQWIDDYGEDSDFVRVWVKGLFPHASIKQLIPEDLVDEAMARTLVESDYYIAPKIIGVDVARQGDDMSVIAKRQGLASFPLIKMHIPDNMEVAAKVAMEIDEWKPDTVFIDQGAGVGVIDRLRQLKYLNIVEVPFGSAAHDSDHYYNKRTEMWCRLRDWLESGGALPIDAQLKDDLIGPEVGHGGKRELIQLETKKHMKEERGLASPDCGDALALTFAYNVVAQIDKDFAFLKKNKVKTTNVMKRMRGQE